MADFDLPFANDSDARRYPTSQDQQEGFICGPADRALFNGLFHRIESELGAVIAAAGIIPSDADMTQVLQAIQGLIDAATGGNPAGYILMDQARARLPIFPDVQNTDGRIVITSPANGQVRLPGGVSFNHRGIFQVTTAQTDYNTDPSKTYHLRWNKVDGFVLKDIADAIYNPSALSELNRAFDSTFDDMLIARIITNSSNIPTIANLANKAHLWELLTKLTMETGTGAGEGSGIIWGSLPRLTVPLNWARTPKVSISRANAHITGLWESITHIGHGTSFNGDTYGGIGNALNRYGGEAWCLGYIFNPGSTIQPTNKWASFPFALEAWA